MMDTFKKIKNYFYLDAIFGFGRQYYVIQKRGVLRSVNPVTDVMSQQLILTNTGFNIYSILKCKRSDWSKFICLTVEYMEEIT